jgi:hypothetical protein
MPVFHSQKLIHLHIPRCGGTSINGLLWSRETNRVGTFNIKEPNYHYLYGVHRISASLAFELDHLDYFEVRRSVSPWVWRSYRKFAVVRHPWDRFVSEYRRKHSQTDRRFISAEADFAKFCRDFLLKVKARDFSAVRRLGSTQFADSHFIPQWRFLGRNLDGLDGSVRMLRLESIDNDWRAFVSEIALPVDDYKLPHRNTQKSKYAETDFIVDLDLAREIELFYADDYRLLGYEFRYTTKTSNRPSLAK